MTNTERRKGREGELEVRKIYERAGLTVRGLEATGDHLIVGGGLVLHSESKRCETARPWAWMAQAEDEVPESYVPVVAFRRNRSRWYAMLPLEDLAQLVALSGVTSA